MINNKILFYVHFNKNNSLSEYVVYQLKQMRPIFDKVVFITNSKINDSDKLRLDKLYDDFISRDNIGFDFAAWRDGIKKVGWKNIAKYDSLTIMNDTCFGPINDFSKIYEQMSSKDVDFWGIAKNISIKNVNPMYLLPAHLQSFYITFFKNVVSSKVFNDFWRNVKNFKNVSDVIYEEELKLTEVLVNNGFKCDAFYNAEREYKKELIVVGDQYYNNINKNEYDPGYSYTRSLDILKNINGYPLFKKKAIFMFPDKINQTRDFILKKTDYPIELLDEYISQNFNDQLNIKIEEMKVGLNELIDRQEGNILQLKRDIVSIKHELDSEKEKTRHLNELISGITSSRTYKAAVLITKPVRVFRKMKKLKK